MRLATAENGSLPPALPARGLRLRPCACGAGRAACQAASRGARTAEQLGGGFQWRRVGDRVARVGGGKGPLIFLYLHAWRTIVLASTSLCSWPAASACSALR